MKFLSALTCIAGLLPAVNGLPSRSVESRQASCNSPRLRKSWNAATAAEKKAYIDAAVCLTKKPSKLGLPGASIHDDFSWVHNKHASEIHGTASFLPWHRFFGHVYIDTLTKECGYTGTALYWDFVADSASPSQASVWDPVTGFGGNGSSPDGSPYSFCVREGPFADLQLQFIGNETIPHCLQRQFMRGAPFDGEQEMLGFNYSPFVVNAVMALPDFLQFHVYLENGPHSGVHIGIANNNGDMGPLTSPNDPIFYLVHAGVDQLWWTWQRENTSRLTDYAGNVWPEDSTGISATLEDILPMGGLAEDRKVRDFMDAGSPELCYRY